MNREDIICVQIQYRALLNPINVGDLEDLFTLETNEESIHSISISSNVVSRPMCKNSYE